MSVQKGCCDLEHKIDRKTPPPLQAQNKPLTNKLAKQSEHDHKHENEHQEQTETAAHDHSHGEINYWPAIVSFILLVSGLLLEHVLYFDFFTKSVKIAWYIAAYIPVGLPVIKEAVEAIGKGGLFTEFFLMSIATIGAFAIGEYAEGVAVMLFYTVGELFQMNAVQKAKGNITALLDIRAKEAHLKRNGKLISVHPESVKVGETIQVKVGEKVPLDGRLISKKASVNTAAISGESKPETIRRGEQVLAGSINLEQVIELTTTKLFEDSSVSKILHLVQDAASRKAKTELLMRRLARVYTPIVFFLAVAVCFLPYFFVENYDFQDWLYRALVFLVISCPCALVISIPLGYFGGLGAASKNGILFKGANFMDVLTRVNTLVMDKTGTLTKGSFTIQTIQPSAPFSESELMQYLLSIEQNSTHPIAKAIMNYPNNFSLWQAHQIEEIAGKGLKGTINNKTVLAGNGRLLSNASVNYPSEIDTITESIVLVAIDGQFAGYVVIADEIKSDAKEIVRKLQSMDIHELIMLSGDKDSITQKVAKQIGIHSAEGGLLPEDKLNRVEAIKQNKEKVVAFIGDGINDAPVLAASDLGVAMGAMGSDVAIETADMVIQTDQPSKFYTGWKISKATRQIIWQNIALAFGVKAIVLTLGAMGMASLWQAVFADVGVALLAILNAVRLQKMNWNRE